MSSARDESEEVRLMSRWYGPAVPRELIEPRQKWPFGAMALWVPREPLEAKGGGLEVSCVGHPALLSIPRELDHKLHGALPGSEGARHGL